MKKSKDDIVMVKEKFDVELNYGNINDIIEQLLDIQKDGYTEIEQDYYGHDGGYTLLKVKTRPENEEEKKQRLWKEEEAVLKEKRAKDKRRAEFEKLKKEFGNG